MKKILFLLFLPGFSAFAQDTVSRWSADLDLGLECMRTRVTTPVTHTYFLPPDTVNQRLFIGWSASLEFYGRVKYFTPNWSAGFFFKPGFGTNLSRNSFRSSWLAIQLPVGIATEIGKTDGHSPGIIFGAALTFNVYDFSEYHIPEFHRFMPYYFIQIHEGIYGIRFAADPNQTYFNKNGSVTKTSYDFEISILGTAPFEKKSK
ncbi:MAG TPA: hypothetical protein VFJ43_14110 [Bacteroidia bacterium]|nr:hypothetical protein [Bacteroidia bacterium]